MINVKSEKGFYYNNPKDYLDGKTNDFKYIYYHSLSFFRYKDFKTSGLGGWGNNGIRFISNDSFKESKEEIAALIEKLPFDFPFYIQKLRHSEPAHFAAYTDFKMEDKPLFDIIMEEEKWRPYDWNSQKDYTKKMDASGDFPLKEGAVDPWPKVVSKRFREKCQPMERKDQPEYFVVNINPYPERQGSWLTEEGTKELEKCEKQIIEIFKGLYEDVRVLNCPWTSKHTDKIINGEKLESIKDINGKKVKVGDSVYFSPYAGTIEKGKITGFTDISVLIDGICYGKVKDVSLVKV